MPISPIPKPRLLALSGPELLASFFDPPRERRLRSLFRFRRSAGCDLEALASDLAAADVLLTTWDSPPLGEELSALAPRLRMIAHCGGEVKARFARPLFERLTITNASAPMAPYVAEMALTFVLHAVRNVDAYRESLRFRSNAVYRHLHVHGGGQATLRGREVGLMGFGRIGRAIARLMKPFGARLLVLDPFVPSTVVESYGATPASLSRLLRCSVLLLAAALTDETRGLIDAQALRQLPDGAVVVNVARGALLDLRALTREVRSGRLRCALDVTDPDEPLPVAHPLRRMRGAVVTPHVAASPIAVRRMMADIVLADLERFARGRAVRNRVTVRRLDRMT